MSGGPLPEPVAFDDLLVHADHVRRLARRLVADDSTADDLAQSTWERALVSPPRDAGNLRAWLSRVTLNLVRQQHRADQRRAHRERRTGQWGSAEPAAEVASRVEELRAVSAAALALDEPFRTAILLRYFEDLSTAQIAERTGVEPATVRTRIHRGLERLRATLADRHGGRKGLVLALTPLLSPDRALDAAVRRALRGVLVTSLWFAAIVGAATWAVVAVDTVPGADGQPVAEQAVPGSDSDGAAPRQPLPVQDSEAGGSPRDDAAREGTIDPAPNADPSSADGLEWTDASSTLPPSLVSFGTCEGQPQGIDPERLEKIVREVVRSPMPRRDNWDAVWSHVLLLSTPEHAVDVGAFAIGRFEVTNAQWRVFLDDPANRMQATVGADARTLGDLAVLLWDIDPAMEGASHQRAWLLLLARNRAALTGCLPGSERADWDPLSARAGDTPLPPGLVLDAPRHLPPAHWPAGELPADERSRPVRGVSWAAATEFCRWAGLHLPTESEWERAARGPKGRLFPWGDDWDPQRAVWAGLNREAPTQPAGRGGPAPDRPVEVDDPRFLAGATPEGLMHMAGNVSEWVAGRATKYPGTAATFYFEGQCVTARGGNYQDDAAFLLTTDRMWDGKLGAMLPSHALEGVGFRVAAYAQPGRDLALGPWLRTCGNDRWRPKRWPGDPLVATSFDGEPALWLDGTAGVLERNWAKEPSDHAVVAGPARGLALLPVRGVRLDDHPLGRSPLLAAAEPAGGILVGLLTGTPGLAIVLGDPNAPDDETRTHLLDFSDPRLSSDGEHMGVALVLRGTRVAVHAHAFDATGSGTVRPHAEPLGWLLPGWEGGEVSRPILPAARVTRGVAELTVGIRVLGRDGRAARSPRHARVTIRVPVRPVR